MIKKTLLRIVQDTLSALDSDEVASISDTIESTQIAIMAEQLFYDIAVDLGLPEHETALELLASGSIDRPCVMTLPENATGVRVIKYDNRLAGELTPNFVDVRFLELSAFIEMMQTLRQETYAGVQEITMNGTVHPFVYRDDQFPTYYTTVDGTTLIFDAYKSSVDSTLQKSKTLVVGTSYPVFLQQDTYIPDLDPAQFPYFMNRLRARAFGDIKQVANVEASSEARRQKVVSQKRRVRTAGLSDFQRTPKYGRK